MKKLFVSIFAAALMLLGSRAQAQVVPGAGYLFSSEKASSEKETTPFHGFYFGASYNFHLVGGLGVAPGLYGSFRAYSAHENAGSPMANYYINGNTREIAINAPVNLTYTADLGPVELWIFAGPVFQYGIRNITTANLAISILGKKINVGDKLNNYEDNGPEYAHLNPFNIFLGGGLGVRIGDVLFTVGYDRSMLDADRRDNNTLVRNQIKAGFNLVF